MTKSKQRAVAIARRAAAVLADSARACAEWSLHRSGGRHQVVLPSGSIGTLDVLIVLETAVTS
jgi:hypothetical protein